MSKKVSPQPVRKFHPMLGLGVCKEIVQTNSGEDAARIVFDSNPQNERTILLKFLSDSAEPLPSYAAKMSCTEPKPLLPDADEQDESSSKDQVPESEDQEEEESEPGATLVGGKTRFCDHGFLIPTDLLKFARSEEAKQLLSGIAKRSPYCSRCWADPEAAQVFSSRFYERPAAEDPVSYGYCHLMSAIVGKRGFFRDAHGRESKIMDLRLRLLQKKAEIKKATAGQSPEYIDNYIRRVLKNYLTNEQGSSAGLVISNSIQSLSDESVRTDRRALAERDAGNLVSELTGGSAESDDDHSLDDKSTLVQAPPDAEPPKRRTGKTDARNLFDTLMAEASSQIATLTGGRKDGFETHLDLERALGKIPDNERQVFAALYLEENGELLNRPRTYADAESLTGLSTQTVRTLERKAVEQLRPALSRAFFKKRA